MRGGARAIILASNHGKSTYQDLRAQLDALEEANGRRKTAIRTEKIRKVRQSLDSPKAVTSATQSTSDPAQPSVRVPAAPAAPCGPPRSPSCCPTPQPVQKEMATNQTSSHCIKQNSSPPSSPTRSPARLQQRTAMKIGVDYANTVAEEAPG